MKRALAILAVCTLGFTGLAQFSGSWSTTLGILPSVTLKSSVLTLTYSIAGFDITSTSTFDSSSFKEQEFGISGSLGALSISGGMEFDPTVPKYESAKVEAALDFAGVTFDFTVTHWDGAYLPTNWTDYCDQTPSALMVYSLGVTADPVTAAISFVDCCDGIVFYDLDVSLTGIDLCCGITYDFDFYFTKANGFEYVKFTLSDLFALYGISFDFGVEFGVAYKKVSLTPKIAWADECLTLGLDVGFTDDYKLTDIGIQYLGISCEYGDCLSLFFGTEFIDGTAPSGWELNASEFEYANISFCGPACCGGQYTVDVSLYWHDGTDETETTLFGLSRVVGSFVVPVMTNLTFTIDMEYDLLETGPNVWTLDIGWTFTF